MNVWSILTDVTKCIGCEECVAACRETNETGPDRNWRWQTAIDDLSASRWTTLRRPQAGRYVRDMCRHCLEPACVSACPVGALKKTGEGAVIYDSAICMGCRYCMMACPFEIPRYDWSQAVPYVRKCILCYEKVKSGRMPVKPGQVVQPACTAACPNGATVFGEREKLIQAARRTIRDQPHKYIQRVYGETKIGGTAVMYISDIPLESIGWREGMTAEPLPRKTWAALRTVPATFLGVGALMAGVWWVIERRQKIAAENAAGTGTGGEGPSEESESNGKDPVDGNRAT